MCVCVCLFISQVCDVHVCYVQVHTCTYLSILEDKEADIFPVMDLVFSEYRRREILNPHPSQLVAMDIIVLKISLQRKFQFYF